MSANPIDFPTINEQPLTQSTSLASKNGHPPDVSAAESDLEALRGYNSVPPRRTIALIVRCHPGGRMKPLPYPDDGITS